MHVALDVTGNRHRLATGVEIPAYRARHLDALGASEHVAIDDAGDDDRLAAEKHRIVDRLFSTDFDGAFFFVAKLRRVRRARRRHAHEQPQCDGCRCTYERRPAKRHHRERSNHHKQRCRKPNRSNQHVLTSYDERHQAARERVDPTEPTKTSEPTKAHRQRRRRLPHPIDQKRPERRKRGRTQHPSPCRRTRRARRRPIPAQRDSLFLAERLHQHGILLLERSNQRATACATFEVRGHAARPSLRQFAIGVDRQSELIRAAHDSSFLSAPTLPRSSRFARCSNTATLLRVVPSSAAISSYERSP